MGCIRTSKFLSLFNLLKSVLVKNLEYMINTVFEACRVLSPSSTALDVFKIYLPPLCPILFETARAQVQSYYCIIPEALLNHSH